MRAFEGSGGRSPRCSPGPCAARPARDPGPSRWVPAAWPRISVDAQAAGMRRVALDLCRPAVVALDQEPLRSAAQIGDRRKVQRVPGHQLRRCVHIRARSSAEARGCRRRHRPATGTRPSGAENDGDRSRTGPALCPEPAHRGDTGGIGVPGRLIEAAPLQRVLAEAPGHCQNIAVVDGVHGFVSAMAVGAVCQAAAVDVIGGQKHLRPAAAGRAAAARCMSKTLSRGRRNFSGARWQSRHQDISRDCVRPRRTASGRPAHDRSSSRRPWICGSCD